MKKALGGLLLLALAGCGAGEGAHAAIGSRSEALLDGGGPPVPGTSCSETTFAADGLPRACFVRMSDGTWIAVFVVLPTQAIAPSARNPVVLTVTPYGMPVRNPGYRAIGAVDVTAHVRGTGLSQGRWQMLGDREQQDYAELVAWASGASFSNGRVAIEGSGYPGMAALLTAAKNPPGLVAAVAERAAHDVYREAAYQNGIFNLSLFTPWSGIQLVTGGAPDPACLDAFDCDDDSPVLRARKHPLDAPIWRERSAYPKWSSITVPTLLVTGWFDAFSRGTIRNFQGIASPQKKLIVDPTPHGNGVSQLGPTPAANDRWPANPAARQRSGAQTDDEADPKRHWLRRHLFGDTSVPNEIAAPVQYWDLTSTDRNVAWHNTTQWPPPGGSRVTLHLSGRPGDPLNPDSVVCEPLTNSCSPLAAQLGLSTELLGYGLPFNGQLSFAAPGLFERKPDSFVYLPAGMTEAAARWLNISLVPFVQIDQRAESLNGLLYTSPALHTPLRLAGPIELHFWAQTENVQGLSVPGAVPDADFIAKLSVVDPDGQAYVVSSGFVRASHRRFDPASPVGEPYLYNDAKDAVPLGVPLEYRVELFPTAYTVKQGQRLRLQITSTDLPTHEPLLQPVRNVVFHDPSRPSRLELFVRP